MNWVGGSRTRVMIKQERRKQKEYFEKNKLRSKMKLLGVCSPVKSASASLDLLNLYMVNQISCQKKMPEAVRKPVHVNMNRDIKMPIRKLNLELPVSPNRAPSNICIDDVQSNICRQRLGSKEERGPAQQTLQGTDSHRKFEPRCSRAGSFSATLTPFSAELSSDRRITEQTFIPRATPSPLKVAYEESQSKRFLNPNCPHTLAPKLNESQDALSPPCKKPAQFGALFDRLNSPGNRSLLPGRAGAVLGADRRSLDEDEQSVFTGVSQPAHCMWGENRSQAAELLEGQPAPCFLSEQCGSLLGSDILSLLSTDQQGVERSGYSSTGSQPPDRCAGNPFISQVCAPGSSTQSATSHPAQHLPCRSYLDELSSSGSSQGSAFLEQDFHPGDSQVKGKNAFENASRENAPQMGVEKYPVDQSRRVASEEPRPEQSWDIGLSEVVRGGARTSAVEDGMKSHKFWQYYYLDSSQSSQSTSYSPRPTESCFSSSSEVLSEDEGADWCQAEGPKGESTSNRTESVAIPPHGSAIDNGAGQQRAVVYPLTGDSSSVGLAQSLCRCSSAHLLRSTGSPAPALAAACDAEVQTDSWPGGARQNAEVQCTLLSPCSCACGGVEPPGVQDDGGQAGATSTVGPC